MLKIAKMMVFFGLLAAGSGWAASDEVIYGTSPKTENPEFSEPKTLQEAKAQIKKLHEVMITNHIIWSIHCKKEEESLIHYFRTVSGGASGAQVPKALMPPQKGGTTPPAEKDSYTNPGSSKSK